MANLYVWAMRTLVPYGVGLVLTATGWLGIRVDSEAAAGAVSLGLAAAYCTVFRLLEELAERVAWPRLQLAAGIMLGWARPPQYVKPVTAPLRLELDMGYAEAQIRQALRRGTDNGGPDPRLLR